MRSGAISIAMIAPVPTLSNEAQRLARLRELMVLDSEPEEVFDTIARTASELCGVPIALLTLVDEERQWFKANVGLAGVNETPRDIAFCAHAIGSDSVFEIPDASLDERFRDNPLVMASPDIRLYAGAPLVLSSGERVGTRCVIDRQSGHLNEIQQRMLQSLAAIAVQALTMRRDLIVRALSIRTEQERALAANERFLRRLTDSLPMRMSYIDHDLRYRFVNLAHCRRFDRSRDQIIGRTRSELTPGAGNELVAEKVKLVLTGQAQRFEYDDEVGNQTRRIESQLIPDISDTGEVRGFFSTGLDITDRKAAERAVRELATIFENTTDYVVQTDARGGLTYLNPAARCATGIAPDEAINHRNFSEFNTPETNQQFADVVVPATAAHGVWAGAATVYGANQKEIPVSHMVIAHRDAAGQVDRYSAVMRNIASEVEAKQQLLRQSNILRSVLEAAPALMVVIGADRRFRYVNSAYERWSRSKRSAIIGRTLLEVLGREEYELGLPWVDQVLAGKNVSFLRAYGSGQRLRHLSLNFIPLWAPGRKVDGFVGVAHDITLHKQEETRLLRLSQNDELTGVLNRSGLEEYLQQHVDSGGGATLALLFIDIDHFKQVNDKLGHAIGDEVLQIFAQRLQRLVRPTDGIARLGGDEFAVVLSGVYEHTLTQTIAQKVVDAARRPFAVNTGLISISASVGIAFGIKPASDWHDLMARADRQTYLAKASGRGRHSGPSE